MNWAFEILTLFLLAIFGAVSVLLLVHLGITSFKEAHHKRVKIDKRILRNLDK